MSVLSGLLASAVSARTISSAECCSGKLHQPIIAYGFCGLIDLERPSSESVVFLPLLMIAAPHLMLSALLSHAPWYNDQRLALE